ncbi:MAG: hypothetical protein U9N33_08180 [Campylobacterota bacterium]|nr:hypothetical protein [Campylobacterota bacterium]
MSKNTNDGLFAVCVSSKGGVGKSTIARQVIAPLLFNNFNEKVKLIEVDDNNTTDTFTSSIFSSQSYKVSAGINEALKSLFEVYNNEKIIIDGGGGNDSNKLVDALLSMDIDKHTIYFIPILKNRSGMKNLINMYKKIRAKSNSKIVVILNQTKSNDTNIIKADFSYFFGSEELNIKGAISDLYQDENLIITNLIDTNVYDLSESLNLTSYEIANQKLGGNFLQTQSKLGQKEFLEALAFKKIHNLCVENMHDSLSPFFNDVGAIWKR